MSAKEKKILRQLFRSRAAIEPTIGHLKSDFGLDRNFLSGTLGDAFNALMAGAAYNIRIRLREIRALIFYTWEGLCCLIRYLVSPILALR
jgi:IS5 family transposase